MTGVLNSTGYEIVIVMPALEDAPWVSDAQQFASVVREWLADATGILLLQQTKKEEEKTPLLTIRVASGTASLVDAIKRNTDKEKQQQVRKQLFLVCGGVHPDGSPDGTDLSLLVGRPCIVVAGLAAGARPPTRADFGVDERAWTRAMRFVEDAIAVWDTELPHCNEWRRLGARSVRHVPSITRTPAALRHASGVAADVRRSLSHECVPPSAEPFADASNGLWSDKLSRVTGETWKLAHAKYGLVNIVNGKMIDVTEHDATKTMMRPDGLLLPFNFAPNRAYGDPVPNVLKQYEVCFARTVPIESALSGTGSATRHLIPIAMRFGERNNALENFGDKAALQQQAVQFQKQQQQQQQQEGGQERKGPVVITREEVVTDHHPLQETDSGALFGPRCIVTVHPDAPATGCRLRREYPADLVRANEVDASARGLADSDKIMGDPSAVLGAHLLDSLNAARIAVTTGRELVFTDPLYAGAPVASDAVFDHGIPGWMCEVQATASESSSGKPYTDREAKTSEGDTATTPTTAAKNSADLKYVLRARYEAIAKLRERVATDSSDRAVLAVHDAQPWSYVRTALYAPFSTARAVRFPTDRVKAVADLTPQVVRVAAVNLLSRLRAFPRSEKARLKNATVSPQSLMALHEKSKSTSKTGSDAAAAAATATAAAADIVVWFDYTTVKPEHRAAVWAQIVEAIRRAAPLGCMRRVTFMGRLDAEMRTRITRFSEDSATNSDVMKDICDLQVKGASSSISASLSASVLLQKAAEERDMAKDAAVFVDASFGASVMAAIIGLERIYANKTSVYLDLARVAAAAVARGGDSGSDNKKPGHKRHSAQSAVEPDSDDVTANPAIKSLLVAERHLVTYIDMMWRAGYRDIHAPSESTAKVASSAAPSGGGSDSSEKLATFPGEVPRITDAQAKLVRLDRDYVRLFFGCADGTVFAADHRPEEKINNNPHNNNNNNSNGEEEANTAALWAMLSICILSLPERAKKISALVDDLCAQARKAHLLPGRDVEILVFLDERRFAIGAKRNALLFAAQGSHVAFIDDDDRVAGDYVQAVVQELRADPTTDVVLFDVWVTGYETMGAKPGGSNTRFGRDLTYRNMPDGSFERVPNHIMPTRLDLARTESFLPISSGEDDDRAKRLCSKMKSDRRIPRQMYYYQFDINTSRAEWVEHERRKAASGSGAALAPLWRPSS